MFVQALTFLSTALLAWTAPVEYDGFNQPGLHNTYATKAFLAPHKHDEDYDDHVEYNFNYSVHDEHTGDIKSQEETRNGDVVQGRYELVDPDGYRRVVEYTADDEHGFNAVVHREPTDLRLAAHKTDPVTFDQYPLNAAKLHRASHYPGSSQLAYGGVDVE